MDQKKKHRIGMVTIILLVIFALVCDLIGLIPLAKNFTATIFWGISGYILWKSGLGIFSGKKIATMAISWVSSMIPVIQEIPIELTAGIIAIIVISRVEEKANISVLGSIAKGTMPAPLNTGGIRAPSKIDGPANVNGVRAPGGGLTQTA